MAIGKGFDLAQLIAELGGAVALHGAAVALSKGGWLRKKVRQICLTFTVCSVGGVRRQRYAAFALFQGDIITSTFPCLCYSASGSSVSTVWGVGLQWQAAGSAASGESGDSELPTVPAGAGGCDASPSHDGGAWLYS